MGAQSKSLISDTAIVTQHSQIVFFINHTIIYKYIPFISFCFVNRVKSLNTGYVYHVVPSIWVIFYIFLASLIMGVFQNP